MAMQNDGHTEVQWNSMLRPHENKWMRLTGFLANISSSSGYLYVLVNNKSRQGKHFGVQFPFEAEELLSHLRKGSKISFDAQVIKRDTGVHLANAELL